MSEQTPAELPPSVPAPTPAGRPRGSKWVVVGLLVLLGGWFAATQIINYTGPPIAWIKNDLDKAEQLARQRGQRVFLLLYEPGCPITAANERNLFSQRLVRERLAKMVCCRVELPPGEPLNPLRVRFADKANNRSLVLPVMLVLEPGREKPLARLEGQVDETQFKTYVPLQETRTGEQP